MMKSIAELETGKYQLLDAQTGKECRLAMQELWLYGKLLPFGGRLFVRHTFRSAEEHPLEVVYAFGLPRDAALRRFRVKGERFSVRSELKTVEEATEEYEEAIERGHLAVLTRQYRDGVVNLNLGNLRPGETATVLLELVAGVELRDDGFRFRFPFTLAPTYHPQARVIEVEPGRGEIELPSDDFGDVILPVWDRETGALHRIGFDLSISMSDEIAEVASPSHPIGVKGSQDSTTRVFMATGGDVPDRDLVLDVTTRTHRPHVFAGLDIEGQGRFAAMIPSDRFGTAGKGSRRVVFVLDRSGSMQGSPIKHALNAVKACLGALTEEDRFSVVAFDHQVTPMGRQLVTGKDEGREMAVHFLSDIDARGGTELLAGLQGGTKLLDRTGGDIFLLTDGQVSGTETIIQGIKSLGIRVHCLGIGSASQDRFLSLLARETGGISRMVTPRERVDMAALELFASAGQPVASDVKVDLSGLPGARVTPEPQRVVFTGRPLIFFGQAERDGGGRVSISWMAGEEERSLDLDVGIKGGGSGDVLRLLQGTRLITEMETQLEPTAPRAAGRRQASRIQRALEKLSFEYGLASRRVALVAVVEREADRPGEVPKTTVVRV